jgi:hypothetical protein
MLPTVMLSVELAMVGYPGDEQLTMVPRFLGQSRLGGAPGK